MFGKESEGVWNWTKQHLTEKKSKCVKIMKFKKRFDLKKKKDHAVT